MSRFTHRENEALRTDAARCAAVAASCLGDLLGEYGPCAHLPFEVTPTGLVFRGVVDAYEATCACDSVRAAHLFAVTG